MSQGQSFRTLDDYLAYRATLGAYDAPYYTEIKPAPPSSAAC